MAKITGDKVFIQKIKKISPGIRQGILAVIQYWAAEVIKDVNRKQPPQAATRGKYWKNRTGEAAIGMFTQVYDTREAIGFLLAHTVPYGPYLELANDRQNAIIMPQLKRVFSRVLRDVKLVMSGELL